MLETPASRWTQSHQDAEHEVDYLGIVQAFESSPGRFSAVHYQRVGDASFDSRFSCCCSGREMATEGIPNQGHFVSIDIGTGEEVVNNGGDGLLVVRSEDQPRVGFERRPLSGTLEDETMPAVMGSDRADPAIHLFHGRIEAPQGNESRSLPSPPAMK